MSIRRSAALLAAAAAGASGCAKQGDAVPVPRACAEGPAAIAAALRDAPGRVRLPDGTALSACVEGARSDGDLQSVGAALTRVAERLEERALAGDVRAALELGYLVGAARRGAGADSALQAELVHRLERSAALDGAGADVTTALQRGMRAGEARG